MYRFRVFRGVAMATTILGLSAPAMAHAQQSYADHAIAALEKARKAREEARQALEEADKALMAAEALLGTPVTNAVDKAASSVPAPPPELRTSVSENAAGGGNASTSPTLCGDYTEAGIADRMLKPRGENQTAADDGLNWFTQNCLGITKWRQYDEKSLNLGATAASSDGIIEAGFGFTTRKLKYSGTETEPSVYSTYRTIRPAVRISTDDATQAALFDLDKFQFADGIGLKLGLEWGRGAAAKQSKVKEDIEASLAKARASCITARGVRDPWAKPKKGEVRPQHLSLLSGDEVLRKCSGSNLMAWMQDDKLGSWTSIVKPVWGYDAKPVMYGGIEGSIAWSEVSYYALRDINTGQPTGIPLPSGFLNKEGAITRETKPYAFSGYFGGSWPINMPFFGGDDGEGDPKGRAGLAGSITYRRTFEFPKSVKDQIVCAQVVTANFDQCRTVNIGAPLEREGLVAAAAFKFELPRMAFLPAIGFTVRPSYAFDIGQLGLEVPIFFLTGSDGKLNSGIKLTCTDDAQTKSGFQIEGECAAALFFGATFSLSGTP